jgi:hypothetical protein|tara:strand:+ start:715 stop:891 length:177 start_codon:yes stop_codon:yes gene_type:complete
MDELLKRVKLLSNVDICILLDISPNLKNSRELLNIELVNKIELDKIDEIELIIIESGN